MVNVFIKGSSIYSVALLAKSLTVVVTYEAVDVELLFSLDAKNKADDSIPICAFLIKIISGFISLLE